MTPRLKNLEGEDEALLHSPLPASATMESPFRVFGLDDGTADHCVGGSVFEGLPEGEGPFLIVRRGRGGTNPRGDVEQAVAEPLSEGLQLQGGGDDSVHAGLGSDLREFQDLIGYGGCDSDPLKV